MTSELYIGPAGWSYPDWEGIVYPRPKPRAFDPLAYLASYFNLIEVNSTFYRMPAQRTCRSWCERVAFRPDFRFTVKAFQEMTHRKAPATPHTVDEFKRALDPLVESNRLSAVLLQFPWSWRCTKDTVEYVRVLNRAFAPIVTAVEVRHGSWDSDLARRFFADTGITQCGIDQPLIGESVGPDVHTRGAAGSYFRLHGRNRAAWFDRRAGRDERYNYMYSPEELTQWTGRVRRAADGEARIHVVLNNHFEGQAVANALEIASDLTGTKPKAPHTLINRHPRLRAVVAADETPRPRPAQGSLFDNQD